MRHETAICGPKHPDPEIPVIIFWAFFFSLNNQNKNAETPIFIVL